MYTQDTIVDVWPFTRQQEGHDFIIGRPETGAFLAVSPEAVEVLDYLAQGRSVGEVAVLSQSEISDLDVFLSSLETQGLVKPLGLNDDIPTIATRAPSIKRYHFSNFPQRVAQCIFSWPVLATCFLLIVLAFGALIHDPTLWPGGRDLYFTRHRTMMLTILMIVSYLSVVMHEVSHVIAAKAQGINSRLGFGNRLWEFVVEADLSGLWSVPKRQRYLPVLAGSILDAVLASLLVFILVAHNHGLVVISPLTLQLLRAIMFMYMTRVMWQAFLFVRTDYYYVIANLFSCRNLMGDTEDFLRNQLARIISRIRLIDQSTIPSPERRVILIFTFVWILGRIAALIFLFRVTIPLARRYTENLIHAIRVGYSANRADLIDSYLMMIYAFVPIGIGMVMWINSIVRRIRDMEVSSS